ncbi:type II toxin-antitoxin system VapC family toxin [Candidatus Marithrix sp. Canyon 246]|uniref:type II toxin-antitoxin system VapC family toxin n=1 Tax=Candidatus Marithrix sp. Canyon 246 TaxID=1827136 RepID=UPI00084A17B8|nr:PIN domain nuclease [Candidatus Marithrix sp. Canyon 246]
MLVVDSSVWIDYFNGKETPQTLFLRDDAPRDQILVGDLILCEVLQGFKHQKHFENAKKLLFSFAYQDMAGSKIALKSAENYRQLRSRGVTIRKTIDVIIATFCIQNEHQLLHSDRDFDAIETNLPLQVYHP